MSQVKSVSADIGGKKLTFETGKFAHQADGAAVITYGDTVVLSTVGMSDSPREGIGFFPLMVDFEPRYYSVGRIKGSRFSKREGRPPESAILISRMTDRPLRPLFPKGMQNDVQIIGTLLQADGKHSAAAAMMNASSMALQLSGIPFEAPVGAVHVGMKDDGSYFLDPTFDEIESGKLDLIVAGTEDSIVMVEAGGDLVSDEQMLGALEFGHQAIRRICALQKELVAQCDVVQKEPVFREISEEAEKAVSSVLSDQDFDTISGATKPEIKSKMKALEMKLLDHYSEQIEQEELKKGDLMVFFEKKFAAAMRRRVFEKQMRIDGRKIDEIRPLQSEVGLLPRIHGSGLFQRGETQALSLLTVGGPGDHQILDDPDRDETKKYYIHHYNFPPYSVGDVRPLRGTGRREIGHGMLAERALRYVMPRRIEDEFPYSIRVVSEILTCNGSSSMASVCGSTLALMDGGIPIKRPIAGIAMGLLMQESGDYKILTDIMSFEDFDGDMDFKVTGDEQGITALQLDIKVKGLSLSLLKEALEQARVGREQILGSMKKVIAEPRSEMSSYAPRVDSFHINPEFIGAVIGKGGETIQGLCQEFEVTIDIEDDGLVMITAVNQDNGKAARKAVESLAYEPKVGDVFEGTVKSVKDFGVFVEYLPGKEALVHVSEMADRRIENPSDVAQEGDRVKVKIVGTDKMGRTQLTMKGL